MNTDSKLGAGSGQTAQEDAARMKLAIRLHPIAWLEAFGAIIDKAGRWFTGRLCPLRAKLEERGAPVLDLAANEMQRRFVEIYRYCRQHGLPCRLIVLKPRQKGSSTGSVAMLYTHLRNYLAKGCIIGDEFEKSVKNLVDMFERYAENDGFPWGNTYRGTERGGKFTHGSELVVETANDPRAGASGTLQALLATEVAHWKRRGEASADKVLLAILSCVAEIANTFVAIESTPNGIGGAYYDMWQAAVDWEDFQRGVRGNGYVRVFFPWFAFADSSLSLTDGERAALQSSLTGDEQKLLSNFNLSLEQLAWRRQTVARQCGGDAKKFEQEYPSDAISCFLSSGRQRFNADGLDAWGMLARKYPPRTGVLSAPNVGHAGSMSMPAFAVTSPNEAWLHVWEEPRVGAKYILSCDPHRGAEQTQGAKKDPDCHSVGVIRTGYLDPRTGVFHRDRLVARIAPPCRVDIDMLADMIAELSRYFGRCTVVVEANAHGLAVLELLKLVHPDVPLYSQRVYNLRESKTSNRLGFQNVDHREGGALSGIRTAIIEGLAAAIRDWDAPDRGLDVCCAHAVQECVTFVVKENGKAEAMDGYHDDDVIMLAMGLYCKAEATPYPEHVVERRMPADLAAALGEDYGVMGSGQYG